MKKLLKLVVIVIICLASVFAFKVVKTSIGDVFSAPNIDFDEEFANKSMYYYDQLNSTEKDAYLKMYASFKNFDSECCMTINSDDLSKIFTAVLYDNPEIFWVKTDYQYYEYGTLIRFKPNYLYTQEKAESYSDKLDDKVNEILNMANSYTTDYEKELFFHDYICANTVYDINTYNSNGTSVYNALVNGKAVCEGYARAMQILLDKSGIYNYLVVGDGISDGETEPHMWNVVRINNENYYLDVTWNDLDNRDEPSYLYFNVTYEIISRDHLNIVPHNNNCSNLDYNYFVKNGTYLHSFSSFSNLIDISSKILRSGKNTVEFYFEKKNDYNMAIKIINEKSKFFDYINSVVKKSGRDLKTDEVEYYTDDNLQYICIIFKEG